MVTPLTCTQSNKNRRPKVSIVLSVTSVRSKYGIAFMSALFSLQGIYINFKVSLRYVLVILYKAPQQEHRI